MRRVLAQLVDGRHFPGDLGHQHAAGGNIGKGQTAALPCRAQAANVVIAALLQHVGLHQGAGGHHPYNIPLDHPLGQRRVFHLLADGNLVALFHQPGNVVFHTVVGHPAHGRTVGKAAVPPGQRQFQLPGGGHGIIKEHLVEISETEHEDLVPMLILHGKVLLHHGG